jgi:hypothetical protein
MGILFCEMEVNCPKQWDELAPTENPLIRNCSDCGKPVHFISSQNELDMAAIDGQCVAFVSETPERSSHSEFQQTDSLQKVDQVMETPRVWRTLGLPRRPDSGEMRPFLSSNPGAQNRSHDS